MHLNDLLLCVCLCALLRSCCLALNNDATELLSPHGHSSSARSQEHQSNVSLLQNRARTGGRGATHQRRDKGQIGCRELRSTKYISDGHCTSLKPIRELVCAGECLPAQLLPNWIGGAPGGRLWAKRSSSSSGGPDWRCVNDKTRTQRIQLQCQDGSTRTYKITVVTSCKCKRSSRQHNQSGGKYEEEEVMSSPHLKHQVKSKRRLGKKKNYMDNWHEP
ncbi:sclerostin domain-containing protein 1a [Periophthalmus magnuspinnatus]|uniref:sclerostin domain-containing protein 1a n=1 Tax=Periophthalmus magnuspinnatus TaxID=409849 RepID=UPI002436E377|nr:sclerostin domain-containing protein 1a [Periophthalmus magnuspinnatus]